MNPVLLIALALILLAWGFGMFLDVLNQRHVEAHRNERPDALLGVMDEETYAKSVRYTLAKSRFGMIEDTWGMLVLLAVLASGLLPWALREWAARLGTSAVSLAGYLFAVGAGLSLASLPFAWVAQFRLEERFGFNRTTQGTWWSDRLKGLALGLTLAVPLLTLVLKCVEWAGDGWWLWAWAVVILFQLTMIVVAPRFILPLFNKFTPLPDGSLKERLLALARRAEFPVQSLQVMDGSKRSSHSNAFFTGLGRSRRIVLFDTLVSQLDEAELEGVLAHEIGHYRKRHIQKGLVLGAVGLLAGLGILAWLARQDWFLKGFGFDPGNTAAALLIFALVSGSVSFWLSPLFNALSRRHEYEADAFAAGLTGSTNPLMSALRKLHEKNLSNLTPHPWYSSFHYSHPTLIEREAALRKLEGTAVAVPAATLAAGSN